MSIWIAIWVVISTALIGFLLWSLLILYRQKTTWKAFAAKHKLRYTPNALMESPDISGAFGEHKISFFTSEHLNKDARGIRKMMAIEVGLNSEMPFEGAIASGEMIPIIKNIGFGFEVRPEHKAWSRSYIATGDSKRALEAYLKDDRIQALCKLMKIQNSWVVFIFRKGQVILRIDTPNPLDSSEKLEKISALMVKIAKVLELDTGEFKALKAEANKTAEKAASAVLDDSGVDDVGGLSIEDDEAEAADESVETSDNSTDSKK